jgi:hypothetical protein
VNLRWTQELLNQFFDILAELGELPVEDAEWGKRAVPVKHWIVAVEAARTVPVGHDSASHRQRR